MGILDNFPHTCTAYLRTRQSDAYGGGLDGFTVVFTERLCWQQAASFGEIEEYAKRGIRVTDKVYFTANCDLDERHELVVFNTLSDSSVRFRVAARSVPDASAGKGVVWKVMCEARTDEGIDL